MGDHSGTLGAVRFFSGLFLALLVWGGSLPAPIPKENPHGWHGRVPSVHFLSVYFFSVYIRSTTLELEGSSFQFLEAETPSFPMSFAKKRRKMDRTLLRAPYFPYMLPKIYNVPHILPPALPKVSPAVGRRRVAPPEPSSDAYGHTTGNTPEPVRFQKLSLVRPS